MKKIIAFILVLSMLLTLAIPAAAAPDKQNGFVQAENTYGAVATAKVIKQNGNTNLLEITVKIGNVIVAFDSFIIANNSAGEFKVGVFKVYVSTYGNDKIDVIFITQAVCVIHDYAEFTVDATCTLDGYTTTICTKGCGYSDTVVLPAFGHDYEEYTLDATCTFDGYTKTTCKNNCDYYDIVIYPALGHNWLNIGTNVGTIGSNKKVCDTCGAISDVYLVRDIPNNNTNRRDIQIGTDGSSSPSPSNGNYAIWWNTAGNAANPTGDRRFLLFTVTVPSAGWYTLDWMWFTRGNDMFNHRHMSINGGAAVALPFRGENANSWEYFPWQVQLKEGTNTIRIWWWENSGDSTNSWLIMDHLRITTYTGAVEYKNFINDFQNVLALNVSAITLANTNEINATLAAYNGLTGIAKELLAEQKLMLDELKARITELEAERDEVLNNLGLEDVLALTLTTVTVANESRVDAALAAYYSLPDDYKSALTLEKKLFDSLKARIGLLKDGNSAQIMLEDWMNVYLKDRGNGVYSTYVWSDRSNAPNTGSDGNETGFWQAANVYELLNDVYENTDDYAVKAQLKIYMDGYRTRFLDGKFSWSGTWQNNGYTDDILWWCNAFVRTYLLTGDVSYLTEAEAIFDRVWTRAWDPREPVNNTTLKFAGVKGGLLWNYDTRANWTNQYPATNEKNIATNGNGVIAAARLLRAYTGIGNAAKIERYTNISKEIYDWMYETMLIDKTTGYLTDNYQQNGNRRDWQFSYNYGLFAGAAYEMWINTGDEKYLADVKLVLGYGWNTLTLEDDLTFKMEGGMDAGDGASFRLVFARYTGLIIKSPEFAEFEKYMLVNAYQTWRHRRTSDGLIGESSIFATDKTVRIPSPIAAYGVVMQLYSGFNPNITYGFEDGLVSWKTGYNSLAEAAGNQIVNMNPIFISGGAGFGANEGPNQIFDYVTTGGTGNPAGTGTKYGGNVPYWAEWRYSNAFVATRLIIATANDNMSWPRRMGEGWTLSGSNDGVNWNVLYTGGANDYSNFNRMFYAFDLPENTTAFQYYRLYSDTGADGDSVQLSVVALAYTPE